MANSVIPKSLAGDVNAINNSTVKITGTRYCGEIGARKIADVCRTSEVPVGLSFWGAQYALDAPSPTLVTTVIINKPVASGNYTVCLLYNVNGVFLSSQLGATGDFVWRQLAFA